MPTKKWHCLFLKHINNFKYLLVLGDPVARAAVEGGGAC